MGGNERNVSTDPEDTPGHATDLTLAIAPRRPQAPGTGGTRRGPRAPRRPGPARA